MNKQDIETLNKLLPSAADRTITKDGKKTVDDIIRKELDRINKDKDCCCGLLLELLKCLVVIK